MDIIIIFALMVAALMVVGTVCALSENKRMKQGKPSRYPESRIMIVKSIDRPRGRRR